MSFWKRKKKKEKKRKSSNRFDFFLEIVDFILLPFQLIIAFFKDWS